MHTATGRTGDQTQYPWADSHYTTTGHYSILMYTLTNIKSNKTYIKYSLQQTTLYRPPPTPVDGAVGLPVCHASVLTRPPAMSNWNGSLNFEGLLKYLRCPVVW